MARTVSEYLVDRLGEWGVQRVFGYPGDGINGVMSALRKAEDRIRFIQVRHEEAASFMACGHAKFTGEVGVCIATSGPGAIHLLNGLYDAKLDGQPVVAIVGQQARTALGGSYQQEVDLTNLFKDVAGDFVQMATEPSQVRHLIDRAFRIAISKRTVTCIILPNDVQELDYAEPKRMHSTIHSSVGYTAPRILPEDYDLQRAAEILNAGKKIAILIGAGARDAEAELMQLAETLGAGIAKALLGRSVLPDDLSYVTGSIGLLGTGPSWDMMNECDTLLLVGTSFPYSEFLPKEGQARAVQIDLDPKNLGLRYPIDVPLHGDARSTLRALTPRLNRKEDRDWQEKLEGRIKKWWKILEHRAGNPGDPVNPQQLFWELSKQLPERSMISADSGSVATWFARDLKIRTGMKATLSGGLATMCPAIPYSIAAKFAFPERPALALLGDGAMQMLGINELITISKYWRTWADPRLIIIVLNNRDLNMVSWEQRIMIGDAKFEGSQNVPEMAYDEYARLLGLEGFRIDKPEDVPRVLQAAIETPKPVVINAYVDPSVPMLPPHVSFEQFKGMSSALFHRDPDSWKMLKRVAQDAWAEYAK